jgi:hypothetical protein
VYKKVPSPIILGSKSLKETICNTYTEMSSIFSLSLISYNAAIVLLLFIIAVLNRNVLVDYNNSANVIMFIIAHLMAIGAIASFFYSSTTISQINYQEAICFALYGQLSSIWVSSSALVPLLTSKLSKKYQPHKLGTESGFSAEKIKKWYHTMLSYLGSMMSVNMVDVDYLSRQLENNIQHNVMAINLVFSFLFSNM